MCPSCTRTSFHPAHHHGARPTDHDRRQRRRGTATYTQAGQNFGTRLLWTLLILSLVLIVNQEMVMRLDAVTREGHARLIFERFGTFCGAFSVGDFLLLNFLTIVEVCYAR